LFLTFVKQGFPVILGLFKNVKMAESIKVQNALDIIIEKLNVIENNTKDSECCTVIPQAGSNASGATSIPAGLSSVTITQTGTGDVIITPVGGVAYTMTNEGETYTVSATNLPSFNITGTATWKWYGV
jgi:hypothetical protein